jgi:hypothetical protein
MSQSRPGPERRKAFAGIIIGVLIALTAAIGVYFDWKPGRGSNWVWLILPAVPLAIWGCANLAKDRGYPEVAAYALFVLSSALAGIVGMSRSPVIFGFAFLFAILMPTFILLSLPKKPKLSTRR